MANQGSKSGKASPAARGDTEDGRRITGNKIPGAQKTPPALNYSMQIPVHYIKNSPQGKGGSHGRR